MRRLLIAPILLLCLPAAMCGERPRPGIPPADKMECPDEPAIPAAPVSDEANGDYLKKLRGAWAGCKADVDWLRAFLTAK